MCVYEEKDATCDGLSLSLSGIDRICIVKQGEGINERETRDGKWRLFVMNLKYLKYGGLFFYRLFWFSVSHYVMSVVKLYENCISGIYFKFFELIIYEYYYYIKITTVVYVQ